MIENWLEEYSELMFGPYHTYETMQEAATLKYANMPSKLYKYRILDNRSIEALERGVLYASSYPKLNDYRELNIVFTDSAMAKVNQKIYNKLRTTYGLPEADVKNIEDIIAITEKTYKEKATGIFTGRDFTNSTFYNFLIDFSNKKTEKAKETAKHDLQKIYNICCFSARNDIDPMWGLYSDKNTGFCIEYDFKSLGMYNEDVQLMLPVLYKEDNRILVDDIDNISGSLSMYAFCLKNQDWSFEREWRHFYPYKTESDPYKTPIPTGIYLGVNAKDQPKIKRIKDYCNNKIPVYQMKYNVYENKLVPNLI